MRNSFRATALGLACALSACVGILPANAGTIFTTASTSGNTDAETRNSGSNYAAVLSFTQNVTISQFGVFTSVNQAQDIKFLIFSSGVNGGTENLLVSDEEYFAQNSTQTYIYSDNLNFTFLAGQTYDIGIMGDGSTLTGLWGTGNYTQNGIRELSANANFNSFNAPTTGGYSGVTPFVQLVTPVPEPASLTILGSALVSLAAVRRRKRKAA